MTRECKARIEHAALQSSKPTTAPSRGDMKPRQGTSLPSLQASRHALVGSSVWAAVERSEWLVGDLQTYQSETAPPFFSTDVAVQYSYIVHNDRPV